MTDLSNNEHRGLATWHQFVTSQDASLLYDLLTEDCIFYSPVLFKPQKGRALVALYLRAALAVFTNTDFHYTAETVQQHRAILEFECHLGEVMVNGVDIIDFNQDGQIVAFKVMVRPLKAIHVLLEKMRDQLSANG